MRRSRKKRFRGDQERIGPLLSQGGEGGVDVPLGTGDEN